MSETIRILVVEDDPATLRNLLSWLGTIAGLEVVGSAMSGAEAIAQIPALCPDLLLLDLELPDMDGIEITRWTRAHHPDAEVLILTSFEDETKVFLAMQAGASGYLVKRMIPSRIQEAIGEVMAGGVVLEPRLARRFWNLFQSVKTGGEAADPTLALEGVERDVLIMIGRGLTNQEAGEVLKLKRRTVKSILARIYGKLGTRSRSEAVMIALRKGLIEL